MDREKLMLKEIDLVQDVIKRMALNSLMVKFWTVAFVITALFLKSKFTTLGVLMTILILWLLDAFFLRLERLFRRLYNWIVENRLKTDEYLFNLDYRRFESQEQSIFGVMFSKTLLLFYGAMLFLTMLSFSRII